MSQVQEVMKNPIFKHPYQASYEAPITHEVEALMKYATKQPEYDFLQPDPDYLKRVFSLLSVSSPQVIQQNVPALTSDIYASKTSLAEVKNFKTSIDERVYASGNFGTFQIYEQ